jgi:DNA-binding GntR family transcriptional regulator
LDEVVPHRRLSLSRLSGRPSKRSRDSRFVEAVRALEYSADDERTLLRHLMHFQPPARDSRIIAEHAEVLDVIRKQRPGAARTAMKAHINSARLRLTKSLRTAKGPGA